MWRGCAPLRDHHRCTFTAVKRSERKERSEDSRAERNRGGGEGRNEEGDR